MLQANIIGVRYPQIQADARTMTADTIEKLIRESGRTQPGVRRVRLEWFANEMSVGDLVVTPDAANHQVWFAHVASDYRFEADPPVNGYFHVRDAEWIGAMDRDLLPEDRRVEASRRPTIVQDLDFGWWAAMAASATKEPKVGRRTRATRAQPRGSARPAGSTTVACSNPDCSYLYPASSLIDGLSPDCHAMA